MPPFLVGLAIVAVLVLVAKKIADPSASVDEKPPPPPPAGDKPPRAQPSPAPAMPAQPAAPPAPEPLSPRRTQALALVADVVPSHYPDAKFAKLAPGFKAEAGPDGKPKLTWNGTPLPEKYTTCGNLPCFVGRGLGDPKGITQCGLESIRTIGKKTGSWVEAGGEKRPKPGDFFIVGNDQGAVLHVGVIIDAPPGKATWKTADAGQGSQLAQEARFVDRPYDPVAVTLGGPAGARKLFGWMDLDKYPLDTPATPKA